MSVLWQQLRRSNQEPAPLPGPTVSAARCSKEACRRIALYCPLDDEADVPAVRDAALMKERLDALGFESIFIRAASSTQAAAADAQKDAAASFPTLPAALAPVLTELAETFYASNGGVGASSGGGSPCHVFVFAAGSSPVDANMVASIWQRSPALQWLASHSLLMIDAPIMSAYHVHALAESSGTSTAGRLGLQRPPLALNPVPVLLRRPEFEGRMTLKFLHALLDLGDQGHPITLRGAAQLIDDIAELHHGANGGSVDAPWQAANATLCSSQRVSFVTCISFEASTRPSAELPEGRYVGGLLKRVVPNAKVRLVLERTQRFLLSVAHQTHSRTGEVPFVNASFAEVHAALEHSTARCDNLVCPSVTYVSPPGDRIHCAYPDAGTLPAFASRLADGSLVITDLRGTPINDPAPVLLHTFKYEVQASYREFLLFEALSRLHVGCPPENELRVEDVGNAIAVEALPPAASATLDHPVANAPISSAGASEEDRGAWSGMPSKRAAADSHRGLAVTVEPSATGDSSVTPARPPPPNFPPPRRTPGPAGSQGPHSTVVSAMPSQPAPPPPARATPPGTPTQQAAQPQLLAVYQPAPPAPLPSASAPTPTGTTMTWAPSPPPGQQPSLASATVTSESAPTAHQPVYTPPPAAVVSTLATPQPAAVSRPQELNDLVRSLVRQELDSHMERQRQAGERQLWEELGKRDQRIRELESQVRESSRLEQAAREKAVDGLASQLADVRQRAADHQRVEAALVDMQGQTETVERQLVALKLAVQSDLEMLVHEQQRLQQVSHPPPSHQQPSSSSTTPSFVPNRSGATSLRTPQPTATTAAARSSLAVAQMYPGSPPGSSSGLNAGAVDEVYVQSQCQALLDQLYTDHLRPLAAQLESCCVEVARQRAAPATTATSSPSHAPPPAAELHQQILPQLQQQQVAMRSIIEHLTKHDEAISGLQQGQQRCFQEMQGTNGSFHQALSAMTGKLQNAEAAVDRLNQLVPQSQQAVATRVQLLEGGIMSLDHQQKQLKRDVVSGLDAFATETAKRLLQHQQQRLQPIEEQQGALINEVRRIRQDMAALGQHVEHQAVIAAQSIVSANQMAHLSPAQANVPPPQVVSAPHPSNNVVSTVDEPTKEAVQTMTVVTGKLQNEVKDLRNKLHRLELVQADVEVLLRHEPDRVEAFGKLEERVERLETKVAVAGGGVAPTPPSAPTHSRSGTL